MYHCCSFKADDIYFLVETDLCANRQLSIGFCPRCLKPVAELIEERFDGKILKTVFDGIKANYFVLSHKDEIVYSMKQCNRNKFKSKPFGWKYGINKNVKIKGENKIRQFACDFYGNKEEIKTV